MSVWESWGQPPDESDDPPAAPARVLVVDDQPLARAGCRLALEAGPGVVVVGETDCGSAVAMAVDHRPDVVVVTGRAPGVDALEVTRRIRADARLGATRVIVFAAAGWDVVDALRARVCGVLSPNAQPEELRRAVRVVAAGDAFLTPAVARQVISEVAVWRKPSPRWGEWVAVLTDRERDVVAAVAQGLSNEAIGRRLHMSPATARTHVSRALIKLGLRNRPQLVVLAYEAGLVTPGADPHIHPLYDSAPLSADVARARTSPVPAGPG
jgi:DNA-binding NarL/FixJ family response regulator